MDSQGNMINNYFLAVRFDYWSVFDSLSGVKYKEMPESVTLKDAVDMCLCGKLKFIAL